MPLNYDRDIANKLKHAQTEHILLRLNETKISLFRKIISLSIEDPFAWMEGQNLYPKFFFENINKKNITMGLGKIISFHKLPRIKLLNTCNYAPKIFGGKKFTSLTQKAVDPWKTFPDELYFLPEIYLFSEKNSHYTLICHSLTKDSRDFTFFLPQKLETMAPSSKYFRIDHPSKNNYKNIFNKATELFKNAQLNKIVLSKMTHLIFDHSLSPLLILKKLKESSVNSTLFAWSLDPSYCFIGTTPEYLYQRSYDQIMTYAIAGTQPKAVNSTKEKNAPAHLFHSSKNMQEFIYVADFIESKLENLCSGYRKKKIKTIATSTLSHLYQEFSGSLKKEKTDSDIIDALHPTPAMGGIPQQKSIFWIDQLEPHNRGYYSSFIGLFSENFAEVIICIRCALIGKKNIFLFSGGGIILKSDFHNEWNELELKISQYLSLL